jgi:O-antigen ligase
VTAPLSPTAPLSRPAPFHLLLCSALVLYVYRVFVVGANLSLFRIVLAGWTVATLVDLLRGRLAPTRWHVALGGAVAGIVVLNAIDFAGLRAHPDLRRDILNHLQNLWFTILLALHLRTHAQVISLLAAFVWSSALASAITLASWLLGALPFEGWLRAHGGPAAQGLPYLGYDPYFHRATSAFFDPNFYGIYSALVALTALGLWIAVEQRRSLLWMAAVNVFVLSASLSRTGVIALLGALAVAFVLYRHAPRPGRRVLAVALVGACVCFLAATEVQSRAQRARLASWWSGATAAAETPPHQDRLTGSATVSDRWRRIRHGWRVFVTAPWLGRGSAALLSPEFPPHASAHLVYLTLLARYGIVGTLVYAAFLIVPLVTITRRRGPPADAIVLTAAACWTLVFVSYDVFLGFEIVYLFVGVAWALAALPSDMMPSVDPARVPASHP